MSHTGIATRKKKVRPVSGDYLKLIKRFPIRPIQNQDDYQAAGAILDELIGHEDLTEGQRDYVAALVRFVQDYDKEHARRELERLTPLEILKHLMEDNEMTTTELGDVLGSRGLASEILNGKRGFSKALIRKLASRFQVDPALFLDQHVPKT
jgi:HTH-type transcriptional regulator/antitoxin HigA